ncbi:MAG: hypothetical protein ACFNUL_05300, partial [Cardiobacterium hominis]
MHRSALSFARLHRQEFFFISCLKTVLKIFIYKRNQRPHQKRRRCLPSLRSGYQGFQSGRRKSGKSGSCQSRGRQRRQEKIRPAFSQKPRSGAVFYAATGVRGEVIHRLPQIFTAPNKKFSYLH